MLQKIYRQGGNKHMPSMNNSNHKRICYDEEGKLECVCGQMQLIDQLFNDLTRRVIGETATKENK